MGNSSSNDIEQGFQDFIIQPFENDIIKPAEEGFNNDIIKPFEQDIIQPAEQGFKNDIIKPFESDIIKPFEETIIKGFERDIIKPFERDIIKPIRTRTKPIFTRNLIKKPIQIREIKTVFEDTIKDLKDTPLNNYIQGFEKGRHDGDYERVGWWGKQ